MKNNQLTILAFGAHPDDCDIKAGGIAAKYSRSGHQVIFVSLTNGDTGHHEIGGIELALRRRKEATAAAKVAGIEYRILDISSGELFPTLENRRRIIEILREVRADLVMSHRPNDYHPDHRAAAELVQDACYLSTVPNNLPLCPALREMPVVVYFNDPFKKPCPFNADVVVNIDDTIESKLDMLHCHDSQMYEWLPYNKGNLATVPSGAKARRKWLAQQRKAEFAAIADDWRELLVKSYGDKIGRKVKCAEAFEACEYGKPLAKSQITRLFPFFPDQV